MAQATTPTAAECRGTVTMRTIEPLAPLRALAMLAVFIGDIYKAQAGIGEGSLPSHARSMNAEEW